MSCEQLQDEFVPYLLGDLERQSALAIESHLAAGCGKCQRDFAAVREALEALFASVPAAPLSVDQQQRILRLALRQRSPNSAALNLTQTTTITTAAADDSAPPLAASTPWRMLQALLSLAAGFFLMIGWHAWQGNAERNVQPTHVQGARIAAHAEEAAQALSGDPQLLPRAKDKVHFVSVKASPTQASLAGYFLADPFSSQLHVVGKTTHLPLPSEQFLLTVATDQSVVKLPLAVEVTGHFKAILPLPESAIREVALNLTDRDR